jgi:glycosyltransferase involved in cell wall biosynthesis
LERFYYSPLKVLESMAVGRVVVASRIGQITELIRDGESGMLVRPGDREELVQAIRKLSSDEPLRRKMGFKASEEIRLYHTWMHRANAIISFARKSGLIQAPEDVARQELHS